MPLQGTLLFNSGWKIEYTNEKNQTKTLICSPEAFLQGFAPDRNTQTEVDFEREESGTKPPMRVRPRGTPWIEASRPEPPAPPEPIRENFEPARRSWRNDNSRNNDRQTQPRTQTVPHQNQNLAPEFHNPYNFVPAPLRDKVTGELADRPPCGHDRFDPDKYSGKLRVRMTVATPLLLPDTARLGVADQDNGGMKKGHKSYPVRVDADGKPLIEPTAIKGMLRAAYEAVTNSRMGVFKEHNNELAFRAAVEDGITVVPCRIEKIASSMCVTLYTGFSDMEEDGGPMFLNPANPRQGRQPMYAAWLRRYLYPHSNGAPMLRGINDDREHERKVWVYVRKWRRGPFEFWNVVEIQPYSTTSPTTDPAETRTRWRGAKEINPAVNGKWVEGHICHGNRNIKSKHDERVFFIDPSRSPDRFILTDYQWQLLADRWETLIKDYIAAEHKGLDPGIVLSRHIDKKEFVLREGSICYARVVKEGSQPYKDLMMLRPGFAPLAEFTKGTDKWLLVELNPVMISRRLHEKSPADLLPKSLQPPYKLSELSPADRVFGWVRQADKEKDKSLTPEEKKIAAYRGQLRIGAVECKGIKQNGTYSHDVIQTFGANSSDWLPLQILGQPKPQQGRFYVAKDKDGNAQDKGRSNEQAGYNDSTTKSLRGRKAYPHHASVPENYWVDDNALKAELNSQHTDLSQEALQNNGRTYFREYIRPKSNDRRDKQNRSIEGWVKPWTEFEFDIHFTNLSDVELGALVWLLSLNGKNENKYFHRFGGGKPLGFGSVKLEIVGEEILDGKEIKKRYESLDGDSATALIDFKAKFENAIKAAYPDSNILESFLRACEGFTTTGLPTHYPRTRLEGTPVSTPVPPNPEGESFKWFVANSRTAQGKVTHGYALPNLWDEIGLPILEHRREGQQHTQRQGQGRGGRNRNQRRSQSRP
jgi:CRISPR-associated protein (TIGR03986 family)